MNYLLLGGTQDTGKTNTIWRLANVLISRGFIVIDGTMPTNVIDFKIVLKGSNKLGNIVTILINSATDENSAIESLKSFYSRLTYNVDIFISSIRDEDWWPRKYFFKTFIINPATDFLLEIPLARISRRRNDYTIALNWYEQTTDNLLEFVLSNTPYSL